MKPSAKTIAAQANTPRERSVLDALRAEIDAGRTNGPYKNAEAVFARLQAKYEAQADSLVGRGLPRHLAANIV